MNAWSLMTSCNITIWKTYLFVLYRNQANIIISLYNLDFTNPLLAWQASKKNKTLSRTHSCGGKSRIEFGLAHAWLLCARICGHKCRSENGQPCEAMFCTWLYFLFPFPYKILNSKDCNCQLNSHLLLENDFGFNCLLSGDLNTKNVLI